MDSLCAKGANNRMSLCSNPHVHYSAYKPELDEDIHRDPIQILLRTFYYEPRSEITEDRGQ
jgi:hypothetical protein